MAPEDKPVRMTPAAKARQRGKPGGERPFDLWLHKQLHAMYDEIASEPLPGDLLALIDRDAESAAPADGDNGAGSGEINGRPKDGEQEK